LRLEEAGRGVVVRYGTGDVNAAPFNVRTRVHEYGGGAWTVADGVLFVSHDADRRLYRMGRGDAAPVALTPEGAWRFADGVIDSRRRRWVGVREDHTVSGQEPVNTIVSIELNASTPSSGRVLVSGHDFYSSPRLSPDGRWLAYLAWDHPKMPWVGTTLYAVPLDEDGAPSGEPLTIAGGETESVFQPEWSPEGSELFFVSDRSGWWNLYRRELAKPESVPLAPMEAEFGRPQWVFGMSTYAFAGPRRLVCAYESRAWDGWR
jgi:dipeptidyl aminopeptidase/acylaminoacyl peptidase